MVSFFLRMSLLCYLRNEDRHYTVGKDLPDTNMVPLTPRKMPRQTRTWIQAILLKSVRNRILQKLTLEIENNAFESNVVTKLPTSAVFIHASLCLLSLYLCLQLFSGRFALHHLFQKIYTCVWLEINVETKFYPHPPTFPSQSLFLLSISCCSVFPQKLVGGVS